MACRHALFLLLAGAMACSPRPPQLDCDTLTLASTTAVPGSWVPILGADTAALADVEMTIQAVAVEMPALVLAQDDGSAVLVAPAHPSGRLEGGAVTVVVGECAPMAFEVEPLTPAPGEVQRLAAAVHADMERTLRQFSTTTAQLTAAPVAGQHPLMVVVGALAGLSDSLARAARPAADDDVGGRLLEAMLSQHGVVTGFRAAATGPVAKGEGGLFTLAAIRQGTLPTFTECARPYTANPPAEDVACWMNAAIRYGLASTGLPKEYLEDAGTMLSLGASIPHPVTSPLFVGAGLAVTLRLAMDDALATLLPKRFDRLNFRLDPGNQDEDANQSVVWNDAEAWASSDTWDPMPHVMALAASLLTRQNKVVGANPAGAKENTTAEVIEQAAEHLIDNLLVNFNTSLGGQATAGAAAGLAAIGPLRYGPIDVTDSRWTNARVHGEALELLGRMRLRPRQAGNARVELSIKAEAFAGQTFSAEESASVDPIQVQLQPGSVTLKPNESTVITATVDHAQDTKLAWTIEPTGGFRIEVLGDGMSVRVTAPPQPNVRPATITARSLADRSFLDFVPDREGRARVRGVGLALTPQHACLLPGEALQFTVEADEQQAWNWSTTAGAISRTGVFTAPRSGSGRATVTVSDPEDPEIKAEARVAFGRQCSCFGRVDLGPPVNRSYIGLAAWRQGNGHFTIGFTPAMSAQEQLANPGTRLELGTVYPGEPTEGTHTLRQATLAGFLNAENQIYGVVDPTGANTGGGVVSLQRVDADRLEGTFVGYISVLMRDPGDWVQAPVTFTFRALRGSRTEQGPFLECYLDATEGGR